MNLPPTLKLIIKYYGHLGLQLHDVIQPLVDGQGSENRRKSLKSYFNLLINLLLNFITLYSYVFFDPLMSKGYPIDPSIPWHVMAAFDTFYLVPTSYLLNTFYYLIFGRKIVHFLATSAHLKRAFERSETEIEVTKKHQKKIYLVTSGLFIFQHFLFALLYWQLIFIYYPRSISSVFCTISNYLTFINPTITLVLLYYGQHGTYHSLKELLKSLKTPQQNLSSYYEAANQLKSMASFSKQLYLLLSAPLGLYLFDTIISTITSFCIAQAFPNFETIFSMAFNLAYILYLIYLNSCIRGLLKSISGQLCNIKLNLDLLPVKLDEGSLFESAESLQIRFQEAVSVYESYYTLRFFHFSPSSSSIDYDFFFHSILLILNYSMLIIQTGPAMSFNVPDHLGNFET